jgi:hypothetical protein
MVTSTERRRERPAEGRLLSGPQLARLGVQILNRHDLLLECMSCGTTWSPTLTHDGKLPPYYWQCPNKCNL